MTGPTPHAEGSTHIPRIAHVIPFAMLTIGAAVLMTAGLALLGMMFSPDPSDGPYGRLLPPDSVREEGEWRVLTWSNVGRSITEYRLAGRFTESASGVEITEVVESAFGIPFRSFFWTRYSGIDLDQSLPASSSFGLVRVGRYSLAIDLKPVRLVANVAFWSLVALCSVLLFRIYRGHKRRRSGRCVACSYSVAAGRAHVCPECGTDARSTTWRIALGLHGDARTRMHHVRGSGRKAVRDSDDDAQTMAVGDP